MINVMLVTAEIGSFQPNDHVEYYPWFTPWSIVDDQLPSRVHSDLDCDLDEWWDVSTEDIGVVYNDWTGIIERYDDYTVGHNRMQNELVGCVTFGDWD
jgi:hypothetical protein